jgi:uncharacterized OB-fold protein
MGFDNFGTISFTTEAKAVDFINYLEQGKFMTTKCRACGTLQFPPKMDCPHCLSSDVEWVEIKGTGKLATYTIVNYGPSGFESEAPYILAIADFDGLRLFGRLSRDVNEADIKVGMGLKVVPLKLPDDKVSYEFQPV